MKYVMCAQTDISAKLGAVLDSYAFIVLDSVFDAEMRNVIIAFVVETY